MSILNVLWSVPVSANSVKGLGEGRKGRPSLLKLFYDTTVVVKSYIYIYIYSIGRKYFSKEKGLFYKVDLTNAGSQRFCMKLYR